MSRTRTARAGLGVGLALVVGCGAPAESNDDRAPERSVAAADRASSWIASLETTVRPVGLCGHAAEARLRELAPALEPCPGGDAAIAVAHLEVGTLIVAASRPDPLGASQVVLWLDGTRIETLPESPPTTPADRDALGLAALVLAHHGQVVVDAMSARGLAPRSTIGFFDSMRLGPLEDTRGRLYAAVANEVVSGGQTTLLLEARVDDAGRVAITRTPLARHDREGRGMIVALDGAPAIARTQLPTPVCGSSDEAAVRLRVPEIPPCDHAAGLLYAAASTASGQLLVVRWDGMHGGSITTLERVARPRRRRSFPPRPKTARRSCSRSCSRWTACRASRSTPRARRCCSSQRSGPC